MNSVRVLQAALVVLVLVQCTMLQVEASSVARRLFARNTVTENELPWTGVFKMTASNSYKDANAGLFKTLYIPQDKQTDAYRFILVGHFTAVDGATRAIVLKRASTGDLFVAFRPALSSNSVSDLLPGSPFIANTKALFDSELVSCNVQGSTGLKCHKGMVIYMDGLLAATNDAPKEVSTSSNKEQTEQQTDKPKQQVKRSSSSPSLSPSKNDEEQQTGKKKKQELTRTSSSPSLSTKSQSQDQTDYSSLKLLAIVDKALNDGKKIHIIGQSMGGALGTIFNAHVQNSDVGKKKAQGNVFVALFGPLRSGDKNLMNELSKAADVKIYVTCRAEKPIVYDPIPFFPRTTGYGDYPTDKSIAMCSTDCNEKVDFTERSNVDRANVGSVWDHIKDKLSKTGFWAEKDKLHPGTAYLEQVAKNKKCPTTLF